MGVKEELLGLDDVAVERVDFKGVPGWEGRQDVFVRVLDGHSANEWESYTVRIDEKGAITYYRHNLWAKMAVLAACDANGVRYFTDADLDAVGRKSRLALLRIYETATKLNKLDSDKGDDPNSPKAGGGDSSSTSAGTSASPTNGNS